MKLVISCAEEDLKKGEQLKIDLDNQHVSAWIYVKSIKKGKIWLKEIDDALAEADYVLGVVTENYTQSIGGIEAYITITDGLQKKDIKFIPLFFIKPESVKSPLIKSITGFNFVENYDEGLRGLLEYLKSEEPESAKILLSKVESRESQNPFRRVRAELFRDNYILLAKAFGSRTVSAEPRPPVTVENLTNTGVFFLGV
jgi:hypothetical protein